MNLHDDVMKRLGRPNVPEFYSRFGEEVKS